MTKSVVIKQSCILLFFLSISFSVQAMLATEPASPAAPTTESKAGDPAQDPVGSLSSGIKKLDISPDIPDVYSPIQTLLFLDMFSTPRRADAKNGWLLRTDCISTEGTKLSVIHPLCNKYWSPSDMVEDKYITANIKYLNGIAWGWWVNTVTQPKLAAQLSAAGFIPHPDKQTVLQTELLDNKNIDRKESDNRNVSVNKLTVKESIDFIDLSSRCLQASAPEQQMFLQKICESYCHAYGDKNICFYRAALTASKRSPAVNTASCMVIINPIKKTAALYFVAALKDYDYLLPMLCRKVLRDARRSNCTKAIVLSSASKLFMYKKLGFTALDRDGENAYSVYEKPEAWSCIIS